MPHLPYVPQYLFPSFWGQVAQGTSEKLFVLLVKKITRTPGQAQTMQKSPHYVPMPTTGCGVQESALKSQ